MSAFRENISSTNSVSPRSVSPTAAPSCLSPTTAHSPSSPAAVTGNSPSSPASRTAPASAPDTHLSSGSTISAPLVELTVPAPPSATDSITPVAAPAESSSAVPTDCVSKNSKSTRKGGKKKKKSRIPALVIMLLGVLLLSYPIISDALATYQASQSIATYTETVSALDEDARAKMMAQAIAYNHRLAGIHEDGDADIDGLTYYDILDTDGTGVIGTLEIPSIGVEQPIRHSTTEDTLMNGTGHMEGTGMPIPTGGSHVAIAGHTGMPGQRMFDEVDDLVPGDIVRVRVLDTITIYQVESSEVVTPNTIMPFSPEMGSDYLTLITCTPYGINDHRLLVHCKALSQEEADSISEGSDKISKYVNLRTIPVVIAVVVVVLLAIVGFIRRRRKKRKQKKQKKQKDNTGEAAEKSPK